MTQLLLVGIGGFVGSVLRYWVSGMVQGRFQPSSFPYGTLTVNVIGCFIIGVLYQLGETRAIFTAETRLLVFVGFLGGFTTFSTFGNETVNLMRLETFGIAAVNIAAHIILGLGAVWLGRLLIGGMVR